MEKKSGLYIVRVCVKPLAYFELFQGVQSPKSIAVHDQVSEQKTALNLYLVIDHIRIRNITRIYLGKSFIIFQQ